MFLLLLEFLLAVFIISEIGIPMIFNLKFFPVLRNLRNRKKLAEVKTDIENSLFNKEISERERDYRERQSDIKRIRDISPIQTEIEDAGIEQDVERKRRELREVRRGSKRRTV